MATKSCQKKQRNVTKKAWRTTKSFSRRKKQKVSECLRVIEKVFIENEHSGEEKHQKWQYACNLYNNLSKEKKDKRCEYAHQNIETFPKKKKIRSVNMIANDIEIILK